MATSNNKLQTKYISSTTMIPATKINNRLDTSTVPPAFSRLPPDGHEFPPNFIEPIILSQVDAEMLRKHSNKPAISDKIINGYSDKLAPEMPKTVPPPIPRKVPSPLKATDISPSGSDKENNCVQPRMVNQQNGESSPSMNGKRNPSNWRKDEKSEKSVRDKIAMFSNGKDDQPILPNKFMSSHLAKSTECLDSTDSTPTHRRGYETLSRKYSDSIENGLNGNQNNYKIMRTRSHSVETLDEVDRGTATNNILDMLPPVCPKPVENTKYEAAYGSKFMVEKSKPVPVLEKAFSVENVSLGQSDIIPPPASYGTLPRKSVNNPPLLRRTSFSGDQTQTEAQRKTAVSTLLEQRKKSISKLRGLVIPEKVPEADVLQQGSVIGMPMIKSKDCDKINNEFIPKMNETKSVPFYARRASVDCVMSISHPKQFLPTYTKVNTVAYTNGIHDFDIYKRNNGLGPAPAKPPRMSLQYNHKMNHDMMPTKGGTDESEDSDSINSSRRSSPLISPGVTPAPDKLPLTRNLSSDTNISITSSNSTLTTGSNGSQASCSSAGSTPTIDMSRKIIRQGSNEINRKSVLALSKSRCGNQERKLDSFVPINKSKRYDEDESTEEEDIKRVSKPLKSRNSLTKDSKVTVEKKEYTNYKLAGPRDVLEGATVNIAQCVEVIDMPDSYNPSKNTTVKKGSSMSLKITTKTEKRSSDEPSPSMSDLAKWVRSEAAKTMPHHGIGTHTIKSKENDQESIYESQKDEKVGDYLKKYTKAEVTTDEGTLNKKRESRFGEPKKLNLQEIRKNFENKTQAASPPVKTPPTVVISPVTTTNTNISKEKAGNHDRFSSWDSVASSSSGVSSMQTSSLIGNGNPNSGSSQNLQSPPSEFGSFSSLGSSHSLITPQDLQLLIEEADPPLQTPDAFVIVLQRDTPESSIGITLAGGSDYEAKEITIHKILTNSPADKDGRLKKGDRLLSINGLSMRGLTHRESLSVLKTPRSEVVLVVTRSKSVPVVLSKSKLSSIGSLSSLADKSDCGDFERKINKNKGCRSLDIDLDLASNEDASLSITTSEEGHLSNDDAFTMSNKNETPIVQPGQRLVELMKDGAGLGFSIEGGFDSPVGDRPLIIKKIFMGGVAEKSNQISAGTEIISINNQSVERMTRIEVWNMMKRLPNGPVKLLVK
uniref:CSON014913 protein n=1 Tax=Culicoides sonorensis TaxID=179676 RepID=A0A336MHR3_CULSO